ncbi:hypothetical protein ERO13_A06G067100v2 [Gossypium hirsutum]|uniref:Senescence/dehydration-associated protein At3g51250 isoform X2 n=1 Tax=Gossypium hirsutum TaxID=3635 RepID=A0ABM3BVU3_GOSHI|nr:senescence/dehydration-associated protein At3g51250-like isoform X2 [Gossypium hirsutum]KAG4194687.1 hypothetical protein ERO13_A06G067100v2 [Gossypium hirsutum]
MGCFRGKSSKASHDHPMQSSSTQPVVAYPENKNLKVEPLLQIPGCRVYLMEEGEALELGKGEFTLVRVLEENVPLAAIVKVGEDVQWPLTKDEPYDCRLMSSLDSFLKEHSCFSGATSTGDKHVDWKEYAPRIESYNNVLAKAIAGGTGQIVKGIFKCSNAYTSQVQKGGETILMQAPTASNNDYQRSRTTRKSSGAVNKSLKRVRKLSKMTEKMSKAMLGIVGAASGTVMAPLVSSKPGKAFLSMVPGEVLLASLDAVNKVLDAAEVAEKQAFSATSSAATRMMTDRFGERAGEATEDVLATAGHCAGAAWNIFKIRKAITPRSTATSGVLNNAAKYRSTKSY